MGAVKGKKLEPVVCPICSNFSSKRLTAFEKHLIDEHQTTAQLLWDKLNNGPMKCACGCGQTTAWYGWKTGYTSVIIGHNANIYKIYDEETAKQISNKRAESLRGKPSWCAGLTKETDERVAKRAGATSLGRKAAFDDGKITAWNKGLTSETDGRVAAAAEHMKEIYASGQATPWAEGLNKENSEKIRAMAAKVSMTHRQTNLRHKLDQMKRLSSDEIRSRIQTGSSLVVVDESLNEYKNDNIPNILVKCTKCDNTFHSSLRRLQHGRCYTCDPGGSRSQVEMSDWLKTVIGGVETNVRNVISPQELDIYVPSHKLAIEYNGLYWHSELQKSEIYHQSKSDKCKDLSITLMHVFEDEWRDRRPIVESMILHRLGMTTDKVGARKCDIVQLNPEQRKAFFGTNHLDGDTRARVTFGLVDSNGRAVAALSLRQPFHKRYDNRLEVARFCTLAGVSVPGALGRLTQAATSYAKNLGISGLMSYVDRRLGPANGWRSSGWTKISSTANRFWWTDFTNRFNRFRYKADKKRGMTEAMVAEEANVFKIWCCGNDVYEINV
jgi:hypothetical protein